MRYFLTFVAVFLFSFSFGGDNPWTSVDRLWKQTAKIYNSEVFHWKGTVEEEVYENSELTERTCQVEGYINYNLGHFALSIEWKDGDKTRVERHYFDGESHVFGSNRVREQIDWRISGSSITEFIAATRIEYFGGNLTPLFWASNLKPVVKEYTAGSIETATEGDMIRSLFSGNNPRGSYQAELLVSSSGNLVVAEDYASSAGLSTSIAVEAVGEFAEIPMQTEVKQVDGKAQVVRLEQGKESFVTIPSKVITDSTSKHPDGTIFRVKTTVVANEVGFLLPEDCQYAFKGQVAEGDIVSDKRFGVVYRAGLGMEDLVKKLGEFVKEDSESK